MANLIFVAGLDNRQGDLNLAQQTDLLKKGYGDTAVISSFRYNANNTQILKAIDDNPTAHIVLFSAGCAKSNVIANHLKDNNIALTLLHINEPYTCSVNTKSIVDNAIKIGVPSSNVYSGGDNCTGNNITGHTKLKDRKSHFASLTPLGKLIFGIVSSSTGSSGTSGTSGTSGISGTASTAGTNGTSGITAPEPEIPKYNIFGKVIIKKKSGPGEVTGTTEIDLTDTKGIGTKSAEFKDLQFTEAGDYVLTLSSTSEDIEPMELKVKVTKEDDVIAQPESKGENKEEKQVDGPRPIITQIDKATIVVPPIKMDQDKGGANKQGSYTEGLGYTPFIWYKGYAIEDRRLKTMRLYHEGIVPKIEFTFEDQNEIMKSDVMPTDDATIDLFLNSTSKNLKTIHMVFKITSIKQGPPKAGQTYIITGTIHLPALYVQNNKTYKGTSFKALRDISKELELGFNSNIDNTDDEMPWLNPNKKPFEFIEDIISRSYINDESFMAGYIDYYYCFNYVDLEKEMKREAGNDMGLDTAGMSEQTQKDESGRLIPLRLTTDEAQRSTSNYVEKYEKINDSTKKSLQEGYATVTKFYDRIKKQFLVFTVDSTTSDGKESIILKGSQYDDKYQKENVKNKFMGKLDTDNVHKNYNYAGTQNRINLNNLNKIVINATLPNANWNLYKYMKIGIDVVNASSTPTNPGIVDWRYSGYYILADIEYLWNGKSMSQKIRLVRKELGKTPDEKRNDPPQQKKPEVKENNPNPVPGATSSVVPAPNSIYKVGDTYLVQDKDGKKYDLLITSILENGIEVKGKLKSKA